MPFPTYAGSAVAATLLVAAALATVRADEPAKPARKKLLDRQKLVRVVDEVGQPVAGALVCPWAVRTSQGHGLWNEKIFGEPPRVLTGADGVAIVPYPRFHVPEEKIEAQELTCRVTHPAFVETAHNDVPVAGDAADAMSTVRLEPGALVEVAVAPALQQSLFAPENLRVLWSGDMGSIMRPFVNDRGRVQLPRLSAGPESVQAVYLGADGADYFSDVQEIQLTEGEQVEIAVRLEPPVRIQGKLDDSVPRPVKNGRVVAEVGRSSGEGTERLWWRDWATIAEDGTFTISAMPKGELQVIALCDGFRTAGGKAPPSVADPPAIRGENRPQVFILDQLQHEITLQMTPTDECEVTVLDPDGKPVAGATVTGWPNVWWWNGGSQVYAHPLYRSMDFMQNPLVWHAFNYEGGPYSAVTDASGRAVVKNLPPGSTSLHISHETLEAPQVDDRRQVTVDVTVDRRAEVTVKLQPKGTDFLGEPAGDVQEEGELESRNVPNVDGDDRKEAKPREISFADLALRVGPRGEKPPNDLERVPLEASRLHGKRVRLRGFMYPPVQNKGIKVFALARDKAVIDFGRLPTIADLIHVQLKEGASTEFTQEAFDVIGTFQFGPKIEGGELIQLYSIVDAEVAPIEPEQQSD